MTAVEFWRQLPKKARVVLIVIAVFLLLGLIGSLSGGEKEQPRGLTSPASEMTKTTTTTPPTPPPVTVREVVDGRTVMLSDGTEVVVSGLAQPGECWAADAVSFARTTLLNQTVQLVDGASLVLGDGKDFAALAVGEGVARAEATAAKAVLDAQSAAQQAARGFWGPSCNGLDVKPAAPQPVVPQPQPEPKPEPAPPADVYYANCSAAKAAGAAPLHVGEPGYRPGLDRDKDGTACET